MKAGSVWKSGRGENRRYGRELPVARFPTEEGRGQVELLKSFRRRLRKHVLETNPKKWGRYGKKLWDLIVQEGFKFNLKIGTVNLIERVESGLLSYGNDMTSKNTPFDCGLGKYCSLESNYEFIGKRSLLIQRKRGPHKDIFKILFDAPIGLENNEVECYNGEKKIGKLTSLIFAPKFNKYMGFMISKVENTINKENIYVKIRRNFFKASIENF